MRFRFLPSLHLVSGAFQSKRYLHMTSFNRVAVIGGGLSGILTGRELIQNSCVPTIFEASKPGGLWGSEHNRMWDSLKTNLSKHTCVVSTHDWPENTPDFPVKKSVESYIKQLSNSLDILSDTVVTKIEMLPGDTKPLYRVSYINNLSGEAKDETFDNVVVSSGFFTKITTPTLDLQDYHGNVLGSQDYRNPASFRNRKVVIVGGSFSGCEVAAEIAKEASEVHHIVSSHAYVVPTYLPEDASNPSSAFLPIDLVLYKVNDRRLRKIQKNLNENIHNEIIFKSELEDAQTHQYFEHLVGIDNDVLYEPGSAKPQKARIVISDEYRRMVKSGKIIVYHGKLKKLTDGQLQISSTHSSSSTDDYKIVEIATDDCVIATGFQPDTEIFCSTIKNHLGISDTSATAYTDFMPMILHREIMHPDLPGLFFVGMYKGPYFGIMELQAKLVAGYATGSIPLPTRETMQQGIDTAHRMRQQQPRPHFPHPDYVGMMFDYATALGCVPPSHFLESHRYITPHYFAGREDIMNSLEKDVEEARRTGKNVAKFVFQALENGKWSFHRTIDDRKSNVKMQVRGTVTFVPIFPSPTGEYLLYKEEGKLMLPNGQEFDTSHYYVYHYNAEKDTLDIFFSTVGKPEVIDRPFITMSFIPTSQGWESKAYHLCGCDNYNAKYIFSFQGFSIPSFQVQFDVDGPEKNYRAETSFDIVRRS